MHIHIALSLSTLSFSPTRVLSHLVSVLNHFHFAWRDVLSTSAFVRLVRLSGVTFHQHQLCHLYVGLPLNGMPCQYIWLHLTALHGFIFRIIPLSVSILSPEAFSVTIIWICICYAFAILWLSVISIHPVLVSIFPLFGVLSIVLVHLFIWMDSWAASRPSKYTYISLSLSSSHGSVQTYMLLVSFCSCQHMPPACLSLASHSCSGFCNQCSMF